MKIHHILLVIIALEAQCLARGPKIRLPSKEDIKTVVTETKSTVTEVSKTVTESTPKAEDIGKQKEKLSTAANKIEKTTSALQEAGSQVANLSKTEAQKLTNSIQQLATETTECDQACHRLKEVSQKAAPALKAQANALARESQRLTNATVQMMRHGSRLASKANADDDEDNNFLDKLWKSLFGGGSKKSDKSTPAPTGANGDKSKLWVYTCRLGNDVKVSQDYKEKAAAENQMRSHESACERKFMGNGAIHEVKTRADYDDGL